MFYKIIPNNSNSKPKFFYSEKNLDKEELEFFTIYHGNSYACGAKEIVLVNENIRDEEFITYINSDIEKVNKEIEKLEKLRENLTISIKQSLKLTKKELK